MTADVFGSLLVEADVARWHGDLSRLGIPHMFLKGVGFDQWLDRSGVSGDVDILVPRAHHRRLRSLLRRRHYHRVVTEPSATTWISDDGRLPVDLHDTIKGAGVTPSRVWAAVEPSVEHVDVAGIAVPVPGSPVRELVVLLHRALGGGPRAGADLAAAIERTDLDTWRAAVDLGRFLGASPFVSMALSVDARSRGLAAAIGVDVGDIVRGPGSGVAVAILPILAQQDRLEQARLVGRFLRIHPGAAARTASATNGPVVRPAEVIFRRAASLPAGVRVARSAWRRAAEAAA
jgi:hypothetical protein